MYEDRIVSDSHGRHTLLVVYHFELMSDVLKQFAGSIQECLSDANGAGVGL